MSTTSKRTYELVIEEHISSDLKFHTVRVYMANEPNVVGVGTAAKSPDDKYNANKGYQVAIKRALNDLINVGIQSTRPKRKPVVPPKWTAEQIERAREDSLQQSITDLEAKLLDQVHTPQDRLEAGYQVLAGKRAPRNRGESYGDWVRRTSPRG